MKKINVDNKYNIQIEKNFDNMFTYVKNNMDKYSKIYVITDDNVCKIYLESILKIFDIKNDMCYIIKNGEQSKNLNTVQDIYKHMLEKGIDRKSIVVAFGGGVVGDTAGFVASTYMRGIPFLSIPTTLLSQVDSSIGGKVGVDFLGKKNIIGSFYNPVFVYINISLLKTLSTEHIKNGLVEIIKHGYILDKEYLSYVFDNIDKIINCNLDILEDVIYKSCIIKKNIVTLDEKETGIRKILNFGHTFGHAIETERGFCILHGQAVAIGIIASLHLSYTKGYIDESILLYAKNMFIKNELYKKINIDIEKVYKNMKYDKKNENGNINIIIIEDIGKSNDERNIQKIQILKALEYALA